MRSSGVASGLGQQVLGGIDDLAQVVGWDVGGHAHRDPLAAVDQQVGESGRQHDRLLHLTGVVVDEVDGVLVDTVEHPHGDRGQATLGVASGGGWVIQGTEVAFGVDERMAEAEGLSHAHQGVVDSAITVRVVLAHHVTGHARALHGRAIGARSHVEHAPQDSAVHRLETVPRIRERPRHDHGHRIVQKGPFHLLLDLDRLGPAEVRC